MVVGAFGLNRPGLISTEIVQAIAPVSTIVTPHGPLLSVAGHGRLVWRAQSFYEEEPETVSWLDSLTERDVLWDIGANVGLYALYAAKFRRCRTIAFEPESQNFALLVQNVSLNAVAERCMPVNVAVSEHTGLGTLRVRYLTKGGAYNLFCDGARDKGSDLPESVRAAESYQAFDGFHQGVFGCSVDDLVLKYGLPVPTHMKIDVDGIEPRIIAGAIETIKSPTLKSVVIELNAKSKEDMTVPEIMGRYGFQLVSQRSNWDSRADKTRASDLPADNMIFSRP